MLGAARLNAALSQGDPAAEAYIAAAGITDPVVKAAVREFFAATKDIRATRDGMWFLFNDDSLSSRVSLINPSHVLYVEEIYVPPTDEDPGYYVESEFVPLRGWRGRQADTQVTALRIDNFPVTHYKQNDGSLSFYGALSGRPTPECHIGGDRAPFTPGAEIAYLGTNAGTNRTPGSIATTKGAAISGTFTGRHLITLTRGIAPDNMAVFRGDSTYNSAPSESDIDPGASFDLYVAAAYSIDDEYQGFASIGANMTESMIADLNDAITAYMSAIGADSFSLS